MTTRDKYDNVNACWPDPMPIPTPDEAIRGTKKLLRKVYTMAKADGQTTLRRPGTFKFRITTGNRRTWCRYGVWSINPNERSIIGGGWGEIVHSVSHWAQQHYWRGKPHGPRHVWLEKELARYAIENFLSGQLHRKPKAELDTRQSRRMAVDKRIAKWESKLRRAETALRKLRRQRKYYEKLLDSQSQKSYVDSALTEPVSMM